MASTSHFKVFKASPATTLTPSTTLIQTLSSYRCPLKTLSPWRVITIPMLVDREGFIDNNSWNNLTFNALARGKASILRVSTHRHTLCIKMNPRSHIGLPYWFRTHELLILLHQNLLLTSIRWETR